MDSGKAAGGTPAPPPTEPILSRSGRKIKPKRFGDTFEQKMKLPPTGQRQAPVPQVRGMESPAACQRQASAAQVRGRTNVVLASAKTLLVTRMSYHI